MTPNQPNSRRSFKNLSPRQFTRRQKRYVDIKFDNNTEDNTPKFKKVNYDNGDCLELYTFGDSSKVLKRDERYVIDVSEEDLSHFDAHKLFSLISFSKSPVVKFMSDGKGIPNYPVSAAKPYMLHFGFWMNNVSHYSGGRVHILLAAHLLASMGHKVTIVTDMMPPMLKDFKQFQIEDRLEFIHGDVCLTSNWLLNNNVNSIDVVIATPRILEAFAYANKWNIPVYAMLLESPNFVSEYRGGLDGTETYWSEYKQCILRYADGVLSNPGPTLDAVKKWLSPANYQGNYYSFPPAINAPVCDMVNCEEENEVTFIGRHLDFKCPDDVIKAVGKVRSGLRPSINFVGSHSGAVRKRLASCADRLDVQLKFYANVTDAEKFYIIKRSKIIIIPSRFEGFGMPPAEALYCEKPVIVYDLAITKWIYGDTLNYIRPGKLLDMSKKIEELLKNDSLRKGQGIYGKKQMYSEKSNIPCLPFKIKNLMREIFYKKDYPKITAGIIVLNGCDTLKPTLDSIYYSVDKIIVVEGVVEAYAVNNSTLVKHGHSIDGTLEFIADYPDPLDKIELVRIEDVYPKRKHKCWQDKNEMQNEIAKRINTEIYLKVDSDEVWKESDIEYIRRTFMNKKDLTVIYMQRWHFWKNLHTVAVGGQWDCAEARAWRWNKEFRHPVGIGGGFNYYVDKDGDRVAEPKYRTLKLMMRMHYHLGYCRNENHIKGKINYYAKRGIERSVKDNYTDWQEGQPTNSTHPDGTSAIMWNGVLPKELDKENYPDFVEVNPKELAENNMNMLRSPNK